MLGDMRFALSHPQQLPSISRSAQAHRTAPAAAQGWQGLQLLLERGQRRHFATGPLVLYMSGTLAKLDGSPSAARAVTLTVLRLAPLALAVEPVR